MNSIQSVDLRYLNTNFGNCCCHLVQEASRYVSLFPFTKSRLGAVLPSPNLLFHLLLPVLALSLLLAAGYSRQTSILVGLSHLSPVPVFQVTGLIFFLAKPDSEED